MKPHHRVPIVECGEPLAPIPLNVFAIENPHPYVKLSAPYGKRSPYYLRETVLSRLIEAQYFLQSRNPGWKIQIFDAYRPIAVQQFMVEYAFAEMVRSQGLVAERLTTEQRHSILEQVYQFWAMPSLDPMMPPPHSTGSAVDVTLVDEMGRAIDMGSPIDEISPRSHPNHFANRKFGQGGQNDRTSTVCDAKQITFHQNRCVLKEVMLSAGFRQHPNEWWHFSLGDQMWAWLMNRETMDTMLVAHYGAVREE